MFKILLEENLKRFRLGHLWGCPSFPLHAMCSLFLHLILIRIPCSLLFWTDIWGQETATLLPLCSPRGFANWSYTFIHLAFSIVNGTPRKRDSTERKEWKGWIFAMITDIMVKADISIVSLQRCKITQTSRHQQATNCDNPLDRENEDRQEKRSSFQKDGR